MEQQMACTPDVFRLCGDQIPDVNRIVACLRQNTSQLSRPCARCLNRTSARTSRRRRDAATIRGVTMRGATKDQSRRYDDQSRRYDDQPRRYDDQPRRYDDE